MNENISDDRDQIKASLKEARDTFYESIKEVLSSLKNYVKVSVSSKKLYFSDFNNKRLLRKFSKEEAKMQKIANKLGIELLVQYDNKLNFDGKQVVNSSNAKVNVSDNLETIKSEKKGKKKHFSWLKKNNKDSKLENDSLVISEDQEASVSDEIKDNLDGIHAKDDEEELIDDDPEVANNDKGKYSFFSKIKNIFRRGSTSSKDLESNLENKTDDVEDSLENEDEPIMEPVDDSTKSDSSSVIPVEINSEKKDDNINLSKVSNKPIVAGKYYDYSFEEVEDDNKKLELNNSTIPEVTSKSKMKDSISNKLLNSNFGLNLRIAFHKVGIALLTVTNFTTEKIADFCDRRRKKDLNNLRELREMIINSKENGSISSSMVRSKSL